MTPRDWRDPEPIPDDLPRLHSRQLIHELLARRGIQTVAAAREFLDDRPRPAPDPSGLPNVQAAVDRIGRALERGERIGVFGDYDADGITATALMTRALRSAATDPAFVVPRLPRRDQGYGLNAGAIDELAREGIDLLVAVDCASSDPYHVDYARALGMDVVVLDHHQVHGDPPAGAIVVSAQLPGGERFADLCAAGVAYMVVSGLAMDGYHVGGPHCEPETELLDLVALGSIADVVPIAGVNRAFVRDGLSLLRMGKRRGIAALARRANLALDTADAEFVSFKIAPRLNAAGRMGDPRIALELLLEDDPIRADRIGEEVERLNVARKAESQRLLDEAEREIAVNPSLLERRVLIVRGKGWPGGLLGPISAQLVERYQRPAIVLTDDGERSHGSARSVEGFDVTAALRGAADLLDRFGGHGQAAGLAFASDRLAAITERLEEALDAAAIALPLSAALQIDADLTANQLDLATAADLERLQPFGPGNEAPVLRVRGVRPRVWDAVGSDKRHLKLQFGFPGGSARAIGFGLAPRSRELMNCESIDLAGRLKIDRWNGQRRIDFHLIDFRPST